MSQFVDPKAVLPSTMSPDAVIRAIRQALAAEEEATSLYETIVESTDSAEVKAVLRSIADEERVHVGELHALLNHLTGNEDELFLEGVQEASDEIGKISRISSRVANDLIRLGYGHVKLNNEPRPARMKKPKVGPQAKRHYKLYIQDLLLDVLQDKYGKERGEKNFEYLIGLNNRAMYPAGQDITDEKAQMYIDLGENIPDDYFVESYFDVWKRWMMRS
jgi:rubrerythrin